MSDFCFKCAVTIDHNRIFISDLNLPGFDFSDFQTHRFCCGLFEIERGGTGINNRFTRLFAIEDDIVDWEFGGFDSIERSDRRFVTIVVVCRHEMEAVVGAMGVTGVTVGIRIMTGRGIVVRIVRIQIFTDRRIVHRHIQYPPCEQSHPPFLQLKGGFFDIYNSIKLFSN